MQFDDFSEDVSPEDALIGSEIGKEGFEVS